MEWLQEGKWCLFFIATIVVSLTLLSHVLGKYRYKLHISGKKIEILPEKNPQNESTKK